MQISLPTARTMGFRGKPAELLNADTNLRYAVKYLAGAYMVAGHDEAQAAHLYTVGYYYRAKRKGLLVATGLAAL
jgi:soluble lytic murein transglycosylase-like protein